MSFSLSAAKRVEKGEKIRDKNNLPAVVYGGGKEETKSLTLDYSQFLKLYKEAGEASLVDLAVDGKPEGKVLIHDIQYDPVTDKPAHVDLRRIDMNKPITASVKLRFVGEPPVIKEQGGTLMRSFEEVQVKCLPKDLTAQIEIDLSLLKTFEDAIKIKDLPLPEGVAITNHGAEELVAKAMPALTEEEIKAMEEKAQPVDLAAIEVAGKKPVEEGEEGAAAEEGAGEKKAEEKKEEPKK